MATAFASRYRDALPQLTRTPFLTDGGIETTLIFHEGYDLPHFAAYDLLTREGGRGRAEALLRAVRPDRARSRGRDRARDAHLAREPRLGRSGSATRPIGSADLNRACRRAARGDA